MATPDGKGLPICLEHAIAAQRAKLTSAHAVQQCLYEVLLYADDRDAVMYAVVAEVVAKLVEGVLEKLDPVHLCRVLREAELGAPAIPMQ